MKNIILEKLAEDGYVVIEDFLDKSEIKELNDAGQELCMSAPKENRKLFSCTKSEDCQNKDTYFLDSADKVRYFFESGAVDENGELLVKPEFALNKVGHALHVEHPVFKKLTCSDKIKEVCYQLGFHTPAVAQSMYIYKNPGVGGEVTAHQDGTFLYTEPTSTIGFWIPLEDATHQNGCLQFIKGSHKSGVHRRFIRNPDKNSKELIVFDRPCPAYPLSNFTAVPVSKGSLVLIHSQAVHRSEPNRSSLNRPAYTFHVIETENTKYSEENWLQMPQDKLFPILYSKS